MTLDNDMVAVVTALVSSSGLFVNTIVHWEKIRLVLFSHVVFVIVEYALVFGCYHFGWISILAGANAYILLVFFDFIRRNDTSCVSVGSAILAAALGTFCFAAQLAFVIKGC